MNTIIKTTLVVVAVAGMIACKKSKDFTNDESTPTGIGYTPVSANPLQDVTTVPAKTLATASTSAGSSTYAAGSTFNVELTFFSQSPIKATTLSATVGAAAKTVVDSIPYAPAYSKNKSLDTLLVPYTVPVAASGTVIRLDYQITNVNTLNIIRTAYIKVL